MSTMNALINGADFYPGIPEDAYHADLLMDEPTLSSGVANLLVARSPLHAWTAHPRLNPHWRPGEATRAMDVGRAIHALVLEGAHGRIAPLPFQDYKSKDARAYRDEARASQKIPLLVPDLEQAHETVAGLAVQLAPTELASAMLEGETEMTLLWQEGRVWCRARLDWVSRDRDLVVDLKTTENGEPNAYLRRMLQLGGDVQCAFYCRGIERLTGRAPKFVELVVEKDPPYAVSQVGLDPAWMAFAMSKVESAIAMWADCLESNHWPSYSTRVCYGQLPAYAAAQWEEREAQSIDWDKDAGGVIQP